MTKRDRAFVSGFGFETMVSTLVTQIPNTLVLSNFECYSFQRRVPTETDMIIITPVKLYVVEAKRSRYFIKGSFNDKLWKVKGNGKSIEILNPIIQNFKHIRSIRSNLRFRGLPPYMFENIVVVPNSCQKYTTCKEIMCVSDMINYITDEVNSKEYVYDVFKVLEDLRRVEYFKGKSYKVR